MDLNRLPAYSGGSYAPWWRRAVAYLIDFAFLTPYYVISWTVGSPEGTAAAAFIALQLVTTAFAIANQIVLQGRTGATVGKLVVGVKVLDEDTGRPIGMLRIFIRGLMHILDIVSLGIGYLWPLWDRRNQTFADKAMGTVVIHRPVKATPPAFAPFNGPMPEPGPWPPAGAVQRDL